MKKDKAIEILELDKTCDFEGDADDLKAAIQLGIEALRSLEGLHNLPYGSPLPPLPSETKE